MEVEILQPTLLFAQLALVFLFSGYAFSDVCGPTSCAHSPKWQETQAQARAHGRPWEGIETFQHERSIIFLLDFRYPHFPHVPFGEFVYVLNEAG